VDNTVEKQKFSHEPNLHAASEELYFWLMRSATSPKQHAETFRLLSQIMRISQISSTGGNYLPKHVEKEGVEALSLIKEQLLDGKIQAINLFNKIERVLKKLVQENSKALIIAYATEIEYIFCIHATYNSKNEAKYQQRFKGYLKGLVNTVNESLSETQAMAITQALSQIVKNPESFSGDPQKTLSESLEKSGVILIEIPSIQEDVETA